MKNILVTGGRGFVGRNLCESLCEEYNILSPSHAELDLIDENSVRTYFENNKVDIVIHCANVGGNRKQKIDDVVSKNLRMFFNLVRCKDLFEKMIHFGSGAEYDKRNALVEVKEEDFEKFIPSDDYGYSKYVMSKYIEEADNIVCLRLFGVYGKYEDFEYKFISNAIVKNLLGLDITIMQNVYFDYYYIKDLVRAIQWFIKNKAEHKCYNLCSGQRIDLKSLAEIVNTVGEHKSKINVMNEGLNKEYSADNSRLMSELQDYKITSYEEGIRDLYEYYKSILHTIDRSLIAEDPYAKKCEVANNTDVGGKK